MLLKVRDGVDEALEFDDASNAIEATEFKLDRREDVECREARELVAVFGGELAAKLTFWWTGALKKRTFPRDEEQVASSDAVRVVRGGIAGWREPNSEFLKPIVDTH